MYSSERVEPKKLFAPVRQSLTQNGKLLYRKPAYLICTDPNANIQEILQAYIWRWDFKVNFRDEKSLLGGRTSPIAQ